MNAAQILANLGFVGSSVVNEAKGKVCVKVWTTKGWVYERFEKNNVLEDSLTAWARTVEPGVWP